MACNRFGGYLLSPGMKTSLDTLTQFLNVRLHLVKEKTEIESRLAAIVQALSGAPVARTPLAAPAPVVPTPAPKKGTMSAAGRARIAAAARARWAKVKGTTPTQAAPKKAKPVISAEGIARIRAFQKARWAKIKADKAAIVA